MKRHFVYPSKQICCSDLIDKFLAVISLGRMPSGSKLHAASHRHLKSGVCCLYNHRLELTAQNLPLWAKMSICSYQHSNCSASLVSQCSLAMTVPTKTKQDTDPVNSHSPSKTYLSLKTNLQTDPFATQECC